MTTFLMVVHRTCYGLAAVLAVLNLLLNRDNPAMALLLLVIAVLALDQLLLKD